MDKDKVRVIKISKEALFEYIYENFIAKQDEYLDVDKTEVSNYFDIDYENGNFIFCAIKFEDEDGIIDFNNFPENKMRMEIFFLCLLRSTYKNL